MQKPMIDMLEKESVDRKSRQRLDDEKWTNALTTMFQKLLNIVKTYVEAIALSLLQMLDRTHSQGGQQTLLGVELPIIFLLLPLSCYKTQVYFVDRYLTIESKNK